MPDSYVVLEFIDGDHTGQRFCLPCPQMRVVASGVSEGEAKRLCHAANESVLEQQVAKLVKEGLAQAQQKGSDTP